MSLRRDARQWLSCWLLLNAVLALLLFCGADATGALANHADYTPFSVDPSVSADTYDETQLYAPGAMRFLRTGTLPSELDIYELRGLDNGYPILHSVIAGGLARGVGTLENAWVILHAVPPAILVLLLYWMASAFTLNQLYRSLIAWATVLVAFGPRNLALLGGEAFIAPLEVTRFPHPALSFTLLVAACILVARMLSAPSHRSAALVGILCGTLFYSYYFYWTAMYIGLGTLFVGAAVIRRWRIAGYLVEAGVVGILVAVPYIVRAFASLRQAGARALMERVGAFDRFAGPHGLLILVFGLAAMLLILRRSRRVDIPGRLPLGLGVPLVLVAVGVVGTGAGLNLQLLTGYDPQRDHFYNRLLQPFGTALAGGVVIALSRIPVSFLALVSARTQRVLPTVAALALVVLLGLAVTRQVTSGLITSADHRASAPSNAVLLWAQRNIAPDDVVGSSNLGLIVLTPAVAGTWNFVPVADRTMADRDEILTRYLVAARLAGESDETIMTAFATDPQPVRPGHPNWIHASYVLFQQSNPTEALRADVQERLSSLDLGAELRTRRLDYFILPAGATMEPMLSYFPNAYLVYANANWQLFDLRGHAELEGTPT